jgi:hypothetical protein
VAISIIAKFGWNWRTVVPEQFVVVVDDFYGGQVIGPFDSWDAAAEYFRANSIVGKVRPIVKPKEGVSNGTRMS